MPTYKNIRIKKRGGGTRLQRVQVLKNGKYKFVKNTSRKMTKKASPKPKKQKRGGSKKGSNPGKVNTVTKRKMTQSDYMMGLATGGPAIQKVLQYAESGDMERITNDIPLIYGGYNIRDRKLDPEWLVNGWGGVGNEIARRKMFRATGTTPMPTKGSLLEHGVYYGKAIINILQNQGDIQAAHLQIHKDYFGVDLTKKGFDAWQPGEMADTALPLLFVKHGKRFMRENGYGKYIPKWM